MPELQTYKCVVGNGDIIICLARNEYEAAERAAAECVSIEPFPLEEIVQMIEQSGNRAQQWAYDLLYQMAQRNRPN